MSAEVISYINLGLTVVFIIVYAIVGTAQKKTIETLQTTVTTQTGLLTNLKGVLEVYDLDKLKQWSTLSIETALKEASLKHADEMVKLKSEYTSAMGKLEKLESSTTTSTTTHEHPDKVPSKGPTIRDLIAQINVTMEVVAERTKLLQELQVVAAKETIDKFPKPEMKPERDQYLKSHYPVGAEAMIEFVERTMKILVKRKLDKLTDEQKKMLE